jgi:putative tryptophan/tyrosine transport system substrate-binding protein
VRRSNGSAQDAIADRYRMRRRELLLLLSAVMTAPRLVSAQRRGGSLGVLDPTNLRESTLPAIREGLEDAGYPFGFVAIEYLGSGWTDSRFNSFITVAMPWVIGKVDVIVAAASSDIQSVKTATSSISIPIVFIGDGNVISAGLIESADGPGSNLTGILSSESEGYLKQFELLTQMLPRARTIAALLNPNSKIAQRQIQQVQEAARGMGIEVKILKVSIDVDFETAFAELASVHVAGLLVGADLFFDTWRERLISLAARYAIPTVYGWREFTEFGGLMSYGPSRAAIWRQAGAYAGKILKGATPADLPVRKPNPKRFELVVNPKTARVLGLTIPQTILASADRAME